MSARGGTVVVDKPAEKTTVTQTEGQPHASGTNRKVTFLLLHVILLVYSFAAVCSKMASGYAFLSLPFIGWYLGVLALLAVYALVWQQVLKRLPLTTAYANKAITMVWGVLWGMLFFNEAFKWNMIPGALLVFVGLWLVVTAENE